MNKLLAIVFIALVGTEKITLVLSESEDKNYYLNNTSTPEIVKILLKN